MADEKFEIETSDGIGRTFQGKMGFVDFGNEGIHDFEQVLQTLQAQNINPSSYDEFRKRLAEECNKYQTLTGAVLDGKVTYNETITEKKRFGRDKKTVVEREEPTLKVNSEFEYLARALLEKGQTKLDRNFGPEAQHYSEIGVRYFKWAANNHNALVESISGTAMPEEYYNQLKEDAKTAQEDSIRGIDGRTGSSYFKEVLEDFTNRREQMYSTQQEIDNSQPAQKPEVRQQASATLQPTQTSLTEQMNVSQSENLTVTDGNTTDSNLYVSEEKNVTAEQRDPNLQIAEHQRDNQNDNNNNNTPSDDKKPKGKSIDTQSKDLHEEKGKEDEKDPDDIFKKGDILQWEEEQILKFANWLFKKFYKGVDKAADWANRKITSGFKKLGKKIKAHYDDKPLPDNATTKCNKEVSKACDSGYNAYAEEKNKALDNTKGLIKRIREGAVTEEDKETDLYKKLDSTLKDNNIDPTKNKRKFNRTLDLVQEDIEHKKELDDRYHKAASQLVRAKYAQNAMGNPNPTPPSQEDINLEIEAYSQLIKEKAETKTLPKRFVSNLDNRAEDANDTIQDNLKEGKYRGNEEYNNKYDKKRYFYMTRRMKENHLKKGYANDDLTSLFNKLGLDENGTSEEFERILEEKKLERQGIRPAYASTNQAQQQNQSQDQQTQQQTVPLEQETPDNTKPKESSVSKDDVNEEKINGNKTATQEVTEEIIEQESKNDDKTEETKEDEAASQTPPSPTEKITPDKKEAQQPQPLPLEEQKKKLTENGMGEPDIFPPENNSEQKKEEEHQTPQATNEPNEKDFEGDVQTAQFTPRSNKPKSMPEEQKENLTIAGEIQTATSEHKAKETSLKARQASHDSRRRYYEQRIKRFNQQSNDNQPKNLAQLRAQKALAERNARR